MESIYYIPKKPDSVPLFDKEKGTVEIVIDGEMIEMSHDLFNKLYKEYDQKNNVPPCFYSVDTTSHIATIESLKKMASELKSHGIKKEDMKKAMNSILEENNLPYAKDTAMELIEDIYGN